MEISEQSWKAVLLNLPDSSFFEIIRNYLGPVKTPYNKHNLITKLFSLIDKNRELIISRITEADAAMLTAIELLNLPDIQHLCSFFAPDKKYLEIYLQLINFEERLLIFRSTDEDKYKLNPVFEEEIKKRVIHPRFLIKSSPYKNKKTDPALWLTPQCLFFTLAFLNSISASITKNGSIRKNLQSQLRESLPDLMESAQGFSRVEVLLDLISSSGLYKPGTGEGGYVNTGFFKKLRFPDQSFVYWLPSYFILSAIGESRGNAENMQSACNLLTHIMSWLPAKKEMTVADISKIIKLFENGRYAEKPEQIIKALAELHILVEHAEDKYHINISIPEWLQYFSGTGNLIISQSYEVTIPSHTDPEMFLFLSTVCSPKRADIYSTYEISKQSIIRAYNLGIDNNEIIGKLEEYSSHSVPENLKIDLKHWNAEFNQVKIYTGTILTLADNLADIVETSGIIDRWIKVRISKGIYLMDDINSRVWKTALEKSGIESIPENYEKKELIYSETEEISVSIPQTHNEGAEPKLKSEDIHSLLELTEKSNLSKEEKQEYKARIEKRLVFLPEQIKPGYLKLEKTEARGLDYLGKVRIIEQAILSGSSLLEVLERGSDGNPVKSLLQPLKLDKSSSELILLGHSLPDFSSRKISVRKISLIRKLKGSVYAP